ncbi:MAG TPA: hypothetical protein DCZ95_12110 [Verrucomicrobia bacterium]|nr:MAG: hypothetical protein A2X46_14160 [Lentisphaerae bacterium GWF2_57_35]HBA84829.1 hypothetical protein [Verrucomicrobiota bacterium]
MNKHTNKLIVTASLLMTLSVGSVGAAMGDFTALHSLPGGVNGGIWPMGTPIESGGQLYGMAQIGGASNYGVVYRANVNGAGYTNLFSFGGYNGRYPSGKLLLHGGYFYGMTARGGTEDNGVVFRMTTNGTGYTLLHSFRATNLVEGAIPWGGLIVNSTNLYGMTYFGGVSNLGVIFRISTTGTGYANLHHFVGKKGDGKHPKGDLLLDGGKLYGMTSEGGSNNAGVVFSLALDGTQFKTLYEFTGKPNDAETPSGSLLKDGNYLYGMAFSGPNKAGVAFSVHTNGGTLNILKAFGGAATGRDPFGSLAKSGSRIYGMTRYGGAHNAGVIFSLGGNYTNDYQWPSGGEPIGDPVFVGSALYGSTLRGGTINKGTLFKYEPDPTDTAMAWCAVTWIESQPLLTVTAGDYCGDRFWVRHNKGAGMPDQAFIGYGKTQNFDDQTWKWIPMTDFADVGSDYEYTGRVGRASAGSYYTAAKFIKGSHVYYAATIGSWGDWTTQLFSPNTWTVLPLSAPSNCTATAYSSSQIDLAWNGDGAHWVAVFRKTTNALSAPVDGTDYTQGYNYADQGLCVYRGSANSFSDGDLNSGTTYYYSFYTENYAYYSSGQVASASTPGGGGGGGRSAARTASSGASSAAARKASTLDSSKPEGGTLENILFQDNFDSGNIDRWLAAEPTNVTWSVTPAQQLRAEGHAADSYSYSIVQNLDVANRNIAVEYDVQYGENAVHAGLIYRGRVLYISPALCGWADEKPVYTLSAGLASNAVHHVSVFITCGAPYPISDLFVDGQSVFVNEPIEVDAWSTNSLGFLSAYGPAIMDWDNVKVIEVPAKP